MALEIVRVHKCIIAQPLHRLIHCTWSCSVIKINLVYLLVCTLKCACVCVCPCVQLCMCVQICLPQGVVCTLHEGDDFGKLALVTDSPRAASIVLREDNCHFLRVDKEDFNRILRVGWRAGHLSRAWWDTSVVTHRHQTTPLVPNLLQIHWETNIS